MTRVEFIAWAHRFYRIFASEGLTCKLTREWAEKVRPHDAKLAELYVQSARANEAIRAHIAAHVEK